MTAQKTLPLPPFYKPRNAELYEYRPDQLELMNQATPWRERHQVRPAGADKAKIHLCLLYTSPSPRDRTRSRMPSSA